MTPFHFVVLVVATIFVWLHPDISGMVLLVVLSGLFWRWSS